MSKKSRISKGFSLVEMLVVLLVFSILAIITTQALVLTLRGTRKSEAVSVVKGNIDYAMSSMERLLRNARNLDCATSTGSRLNYTDEFGNTNVYFSCETSGTDSYIASNSASVRLTSPQVRIVNCSAVFSCNEGQGVPDFVTLSITAQHASIADEEGARITSTTRVYLRTY